MNRADLFNVRLIVAGGRDYSLSELDYGILTGIHLAIGISEIVSGGCAGADSGGERWAAEHQVSIKYFIPLWAERGKAAGPLRNGEMAKYGNALIAFPGGRGTANMVKQARDNGLHIWDLR